MNVVDLLVEAQRPVAGALFKEVLQFGEGRDLGRAEQARDAKAPLALA
jgi:hypothetical protein